MSANKKFQTTQRLGNTVALCNSKKSGHLVKNTAIPEGQSQNYPIGQSGTVTTPIMDTFVAAVRSVSAKSAFVQSTRHQSFFVQSIAKSVSLGDTEDQIVAGKLSIDEELSVGQIAKSNQSIDVDQIASGKRAIGMEDSDGNSFRVLLSSGTLPC
jgi:hypothetical protein